MEKLNIEKIGEEGGSYIKELAEKINEIIEELEDYKKKNRTLI